MSDVCEQIKLGPLLLDMDKGRLQRDDGRAVVLTRQQCRILERLAKRQQKIVTIDALLFELYANTVGGEPEWALNSLRVQIHHTRKKLAALGNQVRIVNRYGAYWLDAEDGVNTKPERLEDLARRVDRLSPDRHDPERFHLDRSDIVAELRQLARSMEAA